MASVVYASDFSTSKLTVSPPKVLDSGAKQSYLNYEGGKLLMQTATSMSVPFGLSVYDKAGPPEYSVEISFRGADTNQEVKEFQDAVAALDDFMIDQGVKNSRQWFKSDLKREVIQAFYTPSLRFGKDKDGNPLPYPPTIKLKLRKVNGDFEAKFYDVKGNPYKGIPIEDMLVKGVQLTAIMECGGVWFAGSKFGLTWRAKQIVVHRLPERLPEFTAFRLGASAHEELASAPTNRAPSGHQPTTYADNLVDDDEALQDPPTHNSAVAAVMPQPSSHTVDDEDADDAEPLPVPKKPVLKKKPILAKK